MPFERYVKRGRVYRPMASIWSRGQIGLNQGAVQRFKLDNFEYAVLFFDAENKRIGIKLTNDETEAGTTKITRGSTGAVISAASFLGFYDIEHDSTTRYAIEFDEDEGLYVINLTKPMAKNESR